MYKLIILLLAVLPQCLNGQTIWQNKVSPEVLAAVNKHENADLLVAFTEQADLRAVQKIRGKAAKATYVYQQLQAVAQRSQSRAWQLLTTHQAGGNVLFIANALAVPNASPALIRQLAELPEVSHIALDPWIYFSGPAEFTYNTPVERNGIEWGVDRVRAPQVWSMGYTGQGITVGGADTGYEWHHPALQSHYRGWNAADGSASHTYHWHDAIHEYSPLNLDSLGNPNGLNPCGLNSPVPCDDHFHGTHTMGTMTGDDGQGNQIGVAPGAKWVGCRNMERGWGRPSSYLECFQWFLAPTDLDGQNADPNQAPHVINNSWYCDYVEGCTDLSVNEILHTAVINLKTSGVFVVVSNGNFGPGCATTYGAPAYFEESFSVGAIRSNDTIANFSSRGPVTIDQSDRLKPNISAPGVSVRSSTLNGQYGNASGTSMAGPHVAGVVALVLSARPDLAGEVEILEDILEQTAYALFDTIGCGNVPGSALPNNTYGFGGVNALAAVEMALEYESSGTETPLSPKAWAQVSPVPVVGEAVFHLENIAGKTALRIFSTAGQAVYQKQWNGNGAETHHIPFLQYPAGVYYWELRTETGVVSGKIVH